MSQDEKESRMETLLRAMLNLGPNDTVTRLSIDPCPPPPCDLCGGDDCHIENCRTVAV